MRDHELITVTAFRGTFDRGEDEVCPQGYFIHSLNLAFLKGGVTMRDGSSANAMAAAIAAGIKVRRMELYEISGEAQRLLILDDAGQIWDSVTGLVILSIPTMTDFSCVVMYERAYISPHNGVTGLPGEKLYVYNGTGTARPSGGNGPSIFPGMTVVNSAQSGAIEKGIHILVVAFESVSGYISVPGAYSSIDALGDLAADISQIPLGPAGTVARVLLMTHTLVTPEPDSRNETFYFIPNGRIPDNVTTIATVSCYDSELMADASYLQEQVSELPAGVGVGQYKSSLITWGENANPAIIRVSKPGEPESHNGADGFLTVYPGIGGGVKNCAEFRNQLLIFKSHRTYSTMSNDDVPATWDVGEVDGSVGTECHGIGQILNIGSNVEDRLFVADRAGLRLFSGTFSDESILTFNVDDIWGRITPTAFQNVETSVDAINFRIYAAVPLDGATTPSHILFGDYAEGLSEEAIRWTLWKFPKRPTSIVCSLVADNPILKFGSLDGYVYKLDPALKLDFGNRIEWIAKFPLLPVGTEDESVIHFTGIRLRARGVGLLGIGLAGLDEVETMQAQSLLLTEKPGRPLWRGFNFTNEHCSVTLSLTNAGDWITMTKFVLYPSLIWEGRAAIS